MAYPDWKIHGDETLAAYLPEDEFKGLLEKRIAIPPDCAAILIRDGQVVEAGQGAHVSVGGIWQRFKEVFGGKHSLRLLVADLKPFQQMGALTAFTKDHVRIQAEIAVELQLDPEKPQDTMGIVSNGISLTKPELFERIRPHLQERVLVHELVQHDAEHLRANPGLQDRIQAEFMKEVERIGGDLGVMVRVVSVNWGLTDEEAQKIHMRDLEREDELKDFEYARVRRDLEREAQTTTFEVRTNLEVEKVKAMSETELEKLLLENRLELRDARDTAQRIEERKALQHALDMAKEERLAVYDQRLADEQNELDRKRIELDRNRLELDFEAETRKLEMELDRLEQVQRIELAGMEEGQSIDLQSRKLRGLQDLEIERERAMHDLDKDKFVTEHAAGMDKDKLEKQSDLEKLRIQATMDPDQLLATQAGLSPAVANVFSERAKTSADKEALLREMIELSKTSKTESEEQAKAMFDKAVENLAKVGSAAARGGGGGGGGAGGGEEEGETVECPSCHFRGPATDRFCRNCGHQMRN